MLYFAGQILVQDDPLDHRILFGNSRAPVYSLSSGKFTLIVEELTIEP